MPPKISPLSPININTIHNRDRTEIHKESKATDKRPQKAKSESQRKLITLNRTTSSQPTLRRQSTYPSFSTQPRPRRVLPSMSLFGKSSSTRTSTQTSVSTQKSPRTPFSLMRRPQANVNVSQRSLFQEIDTPISKLPNDCLLTIFKSLSGFDDYCTLMSVCQRWRRLASQPHLWKKTQFEYTQFSKQLAILHRPAHSFQQLHFIRQLTITNMEASSFECFLRTKRIQIRPFQQAKELCLINMSIPDIRSLALWLKGTLQTLDCRKIRARPASQTHTPLQSFDLRIFSELHQLQHLFIEFAEPVVLSSIQVSLFPLSIPNAERKLPATLKTFSMINVLDYEQQLFGPADRHYVHTVPLPLNEEQQRKINMMLDRWLASENHLIKKYQAFSYLSNLTSLTLDCVSSFTAKVWRLCYVPIAGKLTFLSLRKWPGKGERDSPTTILNKRRLAEPNAEMVNDDNITASTAPLDIHIDDVEIALSDFVTSLVCIEEMRLDQFMCDDGLIAGLRNLRKQHTLERESSKAEEQDIRSYKHCLLNDFRITFHA